MQAWVEEELQSSDFGDERLNERFKMIMDCLSQKPSLSIPAACGGWNETIAAYRFFDNKRVDDQEVLAPHQDATLDRIAKQSVALLIQDTTEIEVTRREEKMEGAGPLNDESRIGFFDHAMLAMTPERVPLGVIEADIWARDWEEFRENQRDKKAKKKKRRQKPIEEKESFRWLQGYQRGCEIAKELPNTTVVVISDSEGDIFECFAEAQLAKEENKAKWITRACQDRNLVSENTSNSCQKLWDEIGSTEVLGTMEIAVSKNNPKSTDKQKRNQARNARTATVTIHATVVTLKGARRPGGKVDDIQVNAVLVRESNPPAGEEAVEWLLLTNLRIDTFKNVCLVIEYYCCRWQIEIYFRVLKSGCKVEELQFETDERFKPCLALYMIVAWRVMYVLMLGRECPDMPCNLVFSDDEWKAVYAVVKKEPLPKKVPTLQQLSYMIASLGGYLGRTCDGPPGPQTTWIGMQRMRDLASAWNTFGPAQQATRKQKMHV